MASLMENLIDVLNKENSEYKLLLELSRRKSPVIVQGDLKALEQITDEEQIIVGRIQHLERSREEVLKDIANVINKDVATLKLTELIKMLAKRPEEQAQLSALHDELQVSVKAVAIVNERNRELITNALELVNFDMNLIQSMNAAPETANYNRGAYNVGGTMGVMSGSFDARQ